MCISAKDDDQRWMRVVGGEQRAVARRRASGVRDNGCGVVGRERLAGTAGRLKCGPDLLRLGLAVEGVVRVGSEGCGREVADNILV